MTHPRAGDADLLLRPLFTELKEKDKDIDVKAVAAEALECLDAPELGG